MEKIISPIVTGTGVEVVHRNLEKYLGNYQCVPINPIKASFPALFGLKNDLTDIVHTIPDIGSTVFEENNRNIITFHGYCVDEKFICQQSSRARRIFYKHVLRPRIKEACQRADTITAVSHFLANLVRDDLGITKEVTVIPNGIDTERFSAKTPDETSEKFRVLFIGKLNNRKGFEHVMRLADKFQQDIEFWVMGKGKQVERDNIYYLPPTPYSQMHNIYSQVDAFLAPTVREGFGLAIAEAMACSLPIISNNCSAIPELIDHEAGGFLYDNPNEIEHFLRMLATEERIRATFGKHNRRKIELKFSLPGMIQSYKTLFKS